VLLDTADTLARLNTDLDVTLVTPGGTPRILDKVVLDTVFFTVTNSKDSVVKAGSAGRSSEDTTVVTLENSSVSLNGDSNWLLVKSGLKLRGRVAGDLGVRFNGDFS